MVLDENLIDNRFSHGDQSSLYKSCKTKGCTYRCTSLAVVMTKIEETKDGMQQRCQNPPCTLFDGTGIGYCTPQYCTTVCFLTKIYHSPYMICFYTVFYVI
jgi:hypothetical protein